jgi:hypothetical protein
MKKVVRIILPQMPGINADELHLWLTSLPELSLVTQVEVQTITWKKAVTGDVSDWIKTVKVVVENIPTSNGVVVWAPEQSLLELSGAIALALPQPGKPVITFAANYPNLSKLDRPEIMSLKAMLINAVFAASADIGEVLVMHESKLYKPSSCQWAVADNLWRVQANDQPIALIDFSLRLQGDYRRRDPEFVPSIGTFDLSTRVSVNSWFPGMGQDTRAIDPSSEALVMLTDAQYWSHPDIQAMRKSFQGKGMPLVWYSRTPWDVRLEDNEVAVMHRQPWWVVLAAQASFGSLKDSAQALKNLSAMTR